MFIGHYAVGLAAKKMAPKASLGTLVAAALWLDIAWPLFLLLGLEHYAIAPGITKLSPFNFTDYPLSHSLVMALAWAALWGLVYLLMGKGSNKGAWVIAALVVSHWFLDLIVHRQDLPILPATDNPSGFTALDIFLTSKHGLGLWNSMPGTLLVEVALFIGGIWIYLKSTKAIDLAGKIGIWAFGAVLLALYLWELFSSNSVPAWLSNSNLVALMGVSQLLFVSWAYWIDDHRKTV